MCQLHLAKENRNKNANNYTCLISTCFFLIEAKILMDYRKPLGSLSDIKNPKFTWIL